MTSLKSPSRKAEAAVAMLLVFQLALPGCEHGTEPMELSTPLVIRVVGREFYWYFTYPGRDGTIGTADDITSSHDLHVPLDHPVQLEVTSDDYVYTFRAPELKLKEAAVPDLLFTIDFLPKQVGSYELEVDPMCGFNFLHDNDVMGQLVVEPIDATLAWLAEAEGT